MITLLQDYLRICTAYPYPDYVEAIALFKRQARSDGFEFKELLLPSGYPMLIIIYQGLNSGLPALVLNHHMDVVPASDGDEWERSPFAGEIIDGKIVGRGTQDMKGVGVVHYAALQELRRAGVELERTVYFIMIPDEEQGGFKGAKEFVEHEVFKDMNIGYVLDEGMPSGNDDEILIKIAERTPIQMKVSSKGIRGHASILHHENSVHRLVQFLNDIVEFQKEQQALQQDPGSLFSINITSLYTDCSILNVIPSLSQATVDFRVPSSCSLLKAIDLFENIVKRHPGITYEIMATSKQRCFSISLTSDFYQVCANAIIKQGMKPKPFAFQATTDARFYTDKGIEAIGITPFTVIPNLHGSNEFITMRDLEIGKKVIVSILELFCKK